MSLEDLKKVTNCSACGEIGHWAGNRQCRAPASKRTSTGTTATRSANEASQSSDAWWPPAHQQPAGQHEHDQDGRTTSGASSASTRHGYSANILPTVSESEYVHQVLAATNNIHETLGTTPPQ
eukprot:1654262-Pyramimonas_sp.AAC.1